MQPLFSPPTPACLQDLSGVTPLPGCSPGSVEFAQLDLCSLKNVRAFAKKFNSQGRRLDVLICNAGIMSPATRLVSDDGLELQFQVRLVLSAATAGAGCRMLLVVMVLVCCWWCWGYGGAGGMVVLVVLVVLVCCC